MILIQVLLRIAVVTTLLLQTLATASAFLSPLATTANNSNNGKQHVPRHHRIGSQSPFPSKSSLYYVLPPSTVSILPTAVLSELLDTTPADLTPPVALPTASIEGLSPTTTTIVFVLGLVPFVWATYEFWSRIAVGASFGTGADSVQIRPGGGSDSGMSGGTSIGEDGNPSKSRGRKVLGDDALVVAYVLFAVAIGSVGIAVYSVISSPPPPM